jgi:3-phosphoshikimate 1-carboxyvinyltransferase
MQVQMLALAAMAKGTSVVVENVFENRFTHAGDLNRMGADIWVNGRTAVVKGVERLVGARVSARDLRGGAALAIAALAAEGETVITGAARLRLKESDRLESVSSTVNKLGGCARVTEDGMIIKGSRLLGGSVDGCNDHRIVMMAASLSTLCVNEVEITDAQACEKSYPDFFDDFRHLGGNAVIS